MGEKKQVYWRKLNQQVLQIVKNTILEKNNGKSKSPSGKWSLGECVQKFKVKESEEKWEKT
jgi:hypothetical protein